MLIKPFLACCAGAPLLIGMVALAPPAEATSRWCHGARATVVGQGIVNGTSHRDVIVLTGPSVVRAGGGNDLVCGSRGVDRIFGGGGNDTIFGGGGNDTESGDAGNDTLDGGPGNDRQLGGLGSDVLVGGSGADRQGGGVGNDILSGGFGNDAENGDAGSDTLNGDRGNDDLNGGFGSDDLDGNDGADSLDGGSDVDYLHSDVKDNVVGNSGPTDYLGDDSSHSAVNPALAEALLAAGRYLREGIVAGEVTGSGNQAVLPDAWTVGYAPVSAFLSHANWFVGDRHGRPVVRGCVDGTADGTNYFKLRLESRDGRRGGERGSFQGKVITTGTCQTNFIAVTTPDDIVGALADASTYLTTVLGNGALASVGLESELPIDPSLTTVLPDSSPAIIQTLWTVADVGSSVTATYCVTAFSGGTAYRLVGDLANGATQTSVFAGPCVPPAPLFGGGRPPQGTIAPS